MSVQRLEPHIKSFGSQSYSLPSVYKIMRLATYFYYQNTLYVSEAKCDRVDDVDKRKKWHCKEICVTLFD